MAVKKKTMKKKGVAKKKTAVKATKKKTVKKVAAKKATKKKMVKPKKTTTKKAKKPVKKSVKKTVAKKTKVKNVKKPTAKKKNVTIKPEIKSTKKKKPAVAKSGKAVKRKAKQEQEGLATMPKKSITRKIVARPMVEAEQNIVDAPLAPSHSSATTVGGFLGVNSYQPSADESYMSARQLEHFRRILLQWKTQLMQEVDSTVVHMKEEAAAYPDPLDRAVQEEGFSLELRTRDRERKLLKKIESSLDLIDRGEYGYCEDCGAEIGIRRLEARPTAEKCIDCKTFQEIREKQVGSN